jgi:tight adherence protein C
MGWILASEAFVAVSVILGALIYAFTPGEIIAGRLTSLLHVSSPVRKSGFKEKQKDRALDTLVSVGKMVSSGKTSSQSQLMLIRAGIRSPKARQAINGVRVLLPLVLLAVVLFTKLYRANPFFVLAISALIGYMLPEFWLVARIRRRQHRIRLGIPDALDLLVICVEAGLGLDQALLRVSEELHIAHPDLSGEFQILTTEMRLGKGRTDALRELANRTGVDDLKALVAMLVQTERFGTSIAQSLRVYSDDMRLKRRQRAEEAAAKVSVKMVPVLVFFIFPALMIVALGPAVLTIMRQLLKL